MLFETFRVWQNSGRLGKPAFAGPTVLNTPTPCVKTVCAGRERHRCDLCPARDVAETMFTFEVHHRLIIK